uniref:BTB domain-containing protein n=1 Tax=Oryza punctata TaxID=4537 RepID=A0A0E0LQW1_ORYPU
MDAVAASQGYQQLKRAFTSLAFEVGTYVLDVHGFSGLRRQHCGGGCVVSPTFTVAGFDWAIRYHPEGDTDEVTGDVAVFVVLVTMDAAAWAHVEFRLLDQTAGEMVTFFGEKDPILFDSGSEDLSTWGTGELATRSFLDGSPYVAGDCLKIECALDVCRDRLTFHDTPPSGEPFHYPADDEPADVTFKIAGETFPAHVSVLAARAPGLLNINTTTPAATITIDNDDDGTPAAAFGALLHFAYTDTLPVATSLDGVGHTALLGHLLVAAERYGMARLRAICERAMCRSLDAETAADTLAMADRHGFAALRQRCAEFMASPDNYYLVAESVSHGRLSPTLRREVWNKYYDTYCSRYGDGLARSEMASSRLISDSIITRSTCATRTARSTHQFEIVGYSQQKECLAVGEFVRSATFAAGGYRWSVRFYPGGFGPVHREFVSVFVKMMSNKGKAAARFDLRLIDRATGLSRSVFRPAQPVVFDYSVKHKKCKGKRGIRAFMRRSDLESSSSAFVRNDRLTIECVIDVVVANDENDPAVAVSLTGVPAPDLSRHLGKLLERQDDVGTDVTFVVKGQPFAAHRIVLAMRSPVFMASLYGPMKENSASRIAIDDMEPAVFDALLRFIYSDTLVLPSDLGEDDYKEMVRQLLEAADRYAMDRLKMICKLILSRSLDAETVAATLAMADQHYCDELKDTTTATESMSKMQTVRGTHRGAGTGAGGDRCIRSGTFTVGGYDWCICFYPEGQRGGDRNHVSVKLRLVTQCATATAFYALRLLDQDTGRAAAVAQTSDAPKVFVSNNPSTACFGRRAFMERSKLEASPACLRDDSVVIDCTVRVVVPDPVVTVVRREPNAPPSNILRQLVAQVESQGTDVTFTVQEETFTAHRLMLAARSPVFKAELYGAMKEKDADHVIPITDVQPAVFKALLHFIYTDDMPPDLLAAADDDNVDMANRVDMARHLLVVADRYAVERLRVICERVLRRSLRVKTVIDTMALAEQHSCGELNEACLQFIDSHSKRIVDSDGYKNLKRTSPLVVADIDIYSRDENTFR